MNLKTGMGECETILFSRHSDHFLAPWEIQKVEETVEILMTL